MLSSLSIVGSRYAFIKIIKTHVEAQERDRTDFGSMRINSVLTIIK